MTTASGSSMCRYIKDRISTEHLQELQIKSEYLLQILCIVSTTAIPNN